MTDEPTPDIDADDVIEPPTGEQADVDSPGGGSAEPRGEAAPGSDDEAPVVDSPPVDPPGPDGATPSGDASVEEAQASPSHVAADDVAPHGPPPSEAPWPAAVGVGGTPDETVDTPPASTASPWPIIGWLLLFVSVTVVGIAAWAGLLMPAVVLDVLSFWPAWVVALLVALALWPLRRRGIARIGAVLPLLLFSWLGGAVGLHLAEWDQLPSASADLRGPSASDVATAEMDVAVSGSLSVRSGAEQLYDARLVRSGGDTGPPDALERMVPSDAVVSLRERVAAGWFRSSGWRVRLNRGPAWTIDLSAAVVDVSTRGLDVRRLSVVGDGDVRVGPPPVDSVVILDGELTLTVPVGAAVEVVGAAAVPGAWETTEDGSRSGGTGAVIRVQVVDGSIARIIEA